MSEDQAGTTETTEGQQDTQQVGTEENTGTSNSDGKEAKPEGQQVDKATQKAKNFLQDQHLDSIVKIKIEGEEHEMSVREALKLQQFEKVSRQKLTQADQMMRQVQQIVKMAKEDPKLFLKETGIDPYEFAEATMVEKYELMQMSPEQKELLEHKQWRAMKEAEEKETKAKQEAEVFSQTEQVELKKLDQEIGEAWKSEGIPAHPYFGAQIAFQMMASSKAGNPLTAKDAAVKVGNEFRSNIKSIFGSMDAQAIHNLLDEDFFKKIRKFDLDKLSAKQDAKLGQQSNGPVKASKAKANPYYGTDHEWRKAMDKIQAQYQD